MVLPGEKELCDFCCKGCPSESGQTLVVGWWAVGRGVCAEARGVVQVVWEEGGR